MLSKLPLLTSETPKIPKGITSYPNGNIEFNGVISPSLSKCIELMNNESWIQLKELSSSWINQASDEEIFQFVRGDFKGFLGNIIIDTDNEVLKLRALSFIWKKNPELQVKYPHFEGITTLTEDQKNGRSPMTNKLWISLVSHFNNHESYLSIYTRSPETDEFIEHFYLIRKEGTAEYQFSQSQAEIEIARKIREANHNIFEVMGSRI